ncbi:MAG: GNAT family N-acetyltransferase, partial [bacterium]
WRVDNANAPDFWCKVLPEYTLAHRIPLIVGRSYSFSRQVNIDLPEVDVPILRDDELELTLLRRTPGNRERMWIPAYEFTMNVGGQQVGRIDLRVGNSFPIITYNGHIGYGVDQQFRGRHYAARSCRLLLPLAQANGMDTIWITANPDNHPSRRTIESLGARLVETIKLPEDSDAYLHGEYEKCRYRLEV